MKTKGTKKPVKRKYRAWVEQVNQAVIDVIAASPEEAADKAYRKWRREYGHSRVSYIQPA